MEKKTPAFQPKTEPSATKRIPAFYLIQNGNHAPCHMLWYRVQVGIPTEKELDEARYVYWKGNFKKNGYITLLELMDDIVKQPAPLVLLTIGKEELKHPIMEELARQPSLVHLEGSNPYHGGDLFIHKIFAGNHGKYIREPIYAVRKG